MSRDYALLRVYQTKLQLGGAGGTFANVKKMGTTVPIFFHHGAD